MNRLKLSIIAVALILVMNYYQFEAEAFEHVAFHNDKNIRESHEQISTSKEENHTSIYSNGRRKRYDSVQNIEEYINNERGKYLTKHRIRGTRNSATESILPLTQNFKNNYQNRKMRSQFESDSPNRKYLPTNREYLPPSLVDLPPSREYLPTNREYLPPNREYLPTNREYLPPNREYLPTNREDLPPSRGYLPVLDRGTETTSTSTAGTVEKISTTQKLEHSTMTTRVLMFEGSENSTQQTPIDSTTQKKTVLDVERDVNATVDSHKKNASPSTATTVKTTSTTQELEHSTMTARVLIFEESENSTQQTPIDSTTRIEIVVNVDKDGNTTANGHKHNASSVPENKLNSTEEKNVTVVVVTGNENITTSKNTKTSVLTPNQENNNCNNPEDSVDHHKEVYHKKYDYVVHHYHHVYHHHHHNIPNIDYYYDDLPHFDHEHHDVPHIQHHHEHRDHNCCEHNPTSTTIKPCSDNSEHKQHIRKHKFYLHYPSYPYFPAYPLYSPISISYVSDDADSTIVLK